MILLIGGTGTVGRLLAAELSARGIACRALVRSPERARAVLGGHPELVQGDLRAPRSLASALAGVERVYLATDVSPELPALQAAALDAARAAGVRHVVKLSNLGADADSDFPIGRWHGEVERHLEASGLAWTHLRPHMFMQNLLHQAAHIKASGELAGPYGRARVSMIDARDIAAVALAALTGAGHEGRAYTLTGPAGISFAQVAGGLADILGRPVRYADVPPAEARRRMIAGGRPDWYTDALLVLFAKWAAGGWEGVSEDAERVTGRPPRPFARFLADYAEAFRAA